MKPINLVQNFSLFQEYWSPRIIGEANGQYLKLAKVQGEFVWHQHQHEDETFLVVQGQLTIRFRDREVVLNPGELVVVPKGVEHQPYAPEETWVMLIEPKETAHTGDTQSAQTVAIADQHWI
ncbi:MAG: cupin domain-containing protein [Anaerolineae bacterium]|nr:cupin domain-containing protein [Anaerolineae bacterium]